MFHIMTTSALLLGAIYVCARCVFPLPWGRTVKILATFICIMVAFRFPLFRWLFGGITVELPRSIALGLSGLFIGLICIIILMLCVDIFSALSALSIRWRHNKKQPFLLHMTKKRVAVLVFSCVFLTSYGMYEAVRQPRVQEVDIVFDNLPADLDGLRIACVGDMHTSTVLEKTWVEGVVKDINAAQTDLILLVGDLLDGSVEDRAEDMASLANLRAKYGVFGCLGNHEYYSGMEQWHAALQNLGIDILLNEHRVITIGNTPLVLGGIADKSGASRMGGEMPDIVKTFSRSPTPQSSWRLLLAHQPGDAAEYAEHHVQLQLSGHTHGGQLPPLTWIVRQANGGFLYGLYRVGDMQLYVTSGAGLWTGFPVRVGTASEIAILTLRTSAKTSNSKSPKE